MVVEGLLVVVAVAGVVVGGVTARGDGCAGATTPVGEDTGDSSPPGDPGTGMMTSLSPRNVGQCVTLERAHILQCDAKGGAAQCP